MREIKFRAWMENKMLSHEDLVNMDQEFYAMYTILTELQEDITFMQYTGLKDKNDKEIYEGDMLRISFREDFQVVRYAKDGYFATSEFALFELIRDEGYTYEVVGNIYENPELLEVML